MPTSTRAAAGPRWLARPWNAYAMPWRAVKLIGSMCTHPTDWPGGMLTRYWLIEEFRRAGAEIAFLDLWVGSRLDAISHLGQQHRA